MLSNDKCILMIRGEKPIIDYKYDILKHPNVKYTTDGKAEYYEHGKVERVFGSVKPLKPEEIKNTNVIDTKELNEIKGYNIVLLSSEEVEEYYLNEETQVEN